MNNDCLVSLLEILERLGFPIELLRKQLEYEFVKGNPEFWLFTHVNYEEISQMEAALYFKRLEKTGDYFLISYKVLLRDCSFPGDDRHHTFFISKGKGVHCNEAFNLLQGRSVYKQELMDIHGGRYSAWIRLELSDPKIDDNYILKQYRPQHGFNLEKVLSKYPILDLEDEEAKAKILSALRAGDQVRVTFVNKSKKELLVIEACPQYQTINIYPNI